MNLKDHLNGGARLDHRLTFNVVVAYEDFCTGNRALSMIGRLFPECGRSPYFSTQNVWKFDLLEIAKFRDLAAAEAAEADMVVISAHDPRVLPAAVKRWMETWIKKRTADPGAFVVLLDDAKKRGICDLWAESYLQMCAIRAGMDLFMQRESDWHDLDQNFHGRELKKNRPLPEASGKIITGVPWQVKRE